MTRQARSAAYHIIKRPFSPATQDPSVHEVSELATYLRLLGSGVGLCMLRPLGGLIIRLYKMKNI